MSGDENLLPACFLYFRPQPFMPNILRISLFVFLPALTQSQTLGGNSIYNFLKLSNSPQLSGLGGVNISNQTQDIGLAFNNPALLRPAMHTQASLVFNSFYAGIKSYHLLAGLYHETTNTTFAAGVNYLHYGSITQTDAAGNMLGDMRPTDYVVQASAARAYGDYFTYGATFKFIHSSYGIYRSSAIAMDVGVTYTDTVHWLQASLVLKNMGAALQKYEGAGAADLPFDVQLGISKKLKNAPIQFSATVVQTHRFNTRYSDADYNEANGISEDTGKKYIFDKIFRHFIIAAQVFAGDKVEITAGYNYLRRKELNIGNAGNGLNGFSIGAGILLKKIQIRYARSYYQNNTAYHQFGLNLMLSDYFGTKQNRK
jgi:hypothetical protein